MADWLKRFRWIWSGRSFGNEIADSMTLPHNLFHRAVVLGGMPMHLVALAHIKEKGVSVVEARGVIAPIVIAGLFAMLAKFGAQETFVAAHSKLVHLYPDGVTQAAYFDAFKHLDELVKA